MNGDHLPAIEISQTEEKRPEQRCRSEPSVQSDCKRDQKKGDQPGNNLLIVSAHRKDPIPNKVDDAGEQ